MNIAYPKTKAAFERAIAGSDKWLKAVEPSQKDDATSNTRTVWWLKTDPDRNCYVSFEYKTLFVSFDKSGWYWFDLDKLHNEYPDRSWSNQLANKNWAGRETFDLLDALYDLFFAPEMRSAKCFRRPDLVLRDKTDLIYDAMVSGKYAGKFPVGDADMFDLYEEAERLAKIDIRSGGDPKFAAFQKEMDEDAAVSLRELHGEVK